MPTEVPLQLLEVGSVILLVWSSGAPGPMCRVGWGSPKRPLRILVSAYESCQVRMTPHIKYKTSDTARAGVGTLGVRLGLRDVCCLAWVLPILQPRVWWECGELCAFCA